MARTPRSRTSCRPLPILVLVLAIARNGRACLARPPFPDSSVLPSLVLPRLRNCVDREQFSDGANGNSSVQSRMTFVIWFGRFRILSAILLASIPECAEQNQSSQYSSCICRLQLLQSPHNVQSNSRRIQSQLTQ